MYPIVPLSVVILKRIFYVKYSVANPKLETLGMNFSSSRVLLGLRSKCKIYKSHPWCKCKIPCATPIVISCIVS